jgi:periplasmic protein TonB
VSPEPQSRATTRTPLVVRKRAARRAALNRVRARTRTALTPAQRAFDPLVIDRKRSRTRILRGLRATLGSFLVHALVVGLGFVTGAGSTGQRDKVEQTIKVEVREPPPPPELPKEPAEVEAEKPKPAPKPIAKAPPPKAPPTPEPPPEQPSDTPPPRVVGISMESTTEGGGGPAFAVGNTRAGTTGKTAVDPNAVPELAPGEDPPAGTNKVSARVPSQGIRYVPPKRVAEPKPVYPDILKQQQLEADVKVSLSIDVTGKVVAVKIIGPSEYPEFNEAAKAAALLQQYEPATRDGVPIPYSLPFTFRFRLEDQ